MTTREKILSESLELFSRRGYEAVSVRDIARAVGIREASLYNHFPGKRAIFDSLLAQYSARWDAFFAGVRMTDGDGRFVADEPALALFRGLTREGFAALAAAVFDQYMTDEVNVKLRRVLTIEQYGSDEAAALFKKVSFGDSLDYQAKLFEALMDEGAFVRGDPEIAALEFFSPIFLIFYKYGGTERLDEARALFLRHVDQFHKTYAVQADQGV